jgi:integrase
MTKQKLPKGITLRGNTYRWAIMVEGQRLTGTAPTAQDAEVDRAAAKRRLLNGDGDALNASKSSPQVQNSWTFKQAVEECADYPSPDGWRDAKSRDHLLMQANDVGKYFGMTTRIATVDKEAIQGYVRALIAGRKSNATINRKLSTLSKVLKFAYKQGGLSAIPEFPTRLKENNTRERELSYSEERQLLEILRNVLGREDNAQAVECMIDLGVRNSELWALQKSDVMFKSNEILILGAGRKGTKNGTTRTLLMSKRVRGIMEKRCASLGPDDRIFPFDNAWMRWTWDKAKELMGMSHDPDFIPYMCRHTCATRIARIEPNLFKLQYWMGHKTLEMTRRYSHLMPKDLSSVRDIIDQQNTTGYTPASAEAMA